MVPKRVMKGTGEEISKYTKAHPSEQFELVLLSEGEVLKWGPGTDGWDRMISTVHSLKGRSHTLPIEATSTEALYD